MCLWFFTANLSSLFVIIIFFFKQIKYYYCTFSFFFFLNYIIRLKNYVVFLSPLLSRLILLSLSLYSRQQTKRMLYPGIPAPYQPTSSSGFLSKRFLRIFVLRRTSHNGESQTGHEEKKKTTGKIKCLTKRCFDANHTQHTYTHNIETASNVMMMEKEKISLLTCF